MIRAVCIGEAMIELRPAGAGLLARGVAGDAFNTAAYLRRSLGPGDEVAFMTVIGEDPLSDELARVFRSEGLSGRLVFRDPARLPGLYLIELDERGERSFHYWRGESAARRWMARLAEAGGAEAVAGVDLVFLSGISLAILSPDDRRAALALMAALRGRVGAVAFDPNIRHRLWAGAEDARANLEAACGLADVVLASDADLAWLWPGSNDREGLAKLHAIGGDQGEAVVTLGAAGVRLIAGSDGEIALPARPARVVDTSGAGDSFNGAYLAARAYGATPVEAAAAGQAVAARVVGSPGALVPAEVSHPQRRDSDPEAPR